AAGRFVDEIVPVQVPAQGIGTVIDQDQGPRADSSMEKLARLRPVFKTDGTVTAGNSSGINDGAAVVVVCSESALRRLNLEPLARIRAAASAAVDPRSEERRVGKEGSWRRPGRPD